MRSEEVSACAVGRVLEVGRTEASGGEPGTGRIRTLPTDVTSDAVGGANQMAVERRTCERSGGALSARAVPRRGGYRTARSG